MTIIIYVVGGSYPMPVAGLDQFAWYETVINDPGTPTMIVDLLTVSPYP